MPKYLICISLNAGGNNFYQYYIVNKENLDKLKKINLEVDGSCCGSTQCIACFLQGIIIKFEKYIEIKSDDNMLFAKFVCKKPFYKLEELFELIEKNKKNVSECV